MVTAKVIWAGSLLGGMLGGQMAELNSSLRRKSTTLRDETVSVSIVDLNL
jgi:hypothetical protein